MTEGMRDIKKPLNIFVFWHKDFKAGSNYANELYTSFSRAVNEPLSRGLGIPVFFRSDPACRNIDCGSARKTAIILLIEAQMVVAGEWRKLVEELVRDSQEDSGIVIYPVALTNIAFKMSSSLAETNFIRLYEQTNENFKLPFLVYRVTHEICRLLYGLKRVSEVTSTEYSPAPIRLFISHAKEDGEVLARNLHDFVGRNTALDTFFDAFDIAAGYKFQKEIEANIEDSVLLVIHSDKYSTREWCRREIVHAKKTNRPILVVNTLNNGEDRVFPYMANVKSVRVPPTNDEEMYIKIISCTLMETLRFKYQALYLEYVSMKFGVDLETADIFAYPPELLSLINRNDSYNIRDTRGTRDTSDTRITSDISKELIIYPDPPLSDEEIGILKAYESKLHFVTPTVMPMISGMQNKRFEYKFLLDFKIGISISQSSNISECGLEFIHLQDMIVELARYLLVAGASLAYGGDINYNGKYNFIKLLIDLVSNHNKEHHDIQQIINNYAAYPLYESVDVDTKASLMDICNFIEIPCLAEYGDNTGNTDESPLAVKYICARNLTNMRQIMNSEITARVITGGKTSGHSGIYPGLIEEAYLALQGNKPVYLLGAFGGAAKAIIQCLKGQVPQELTTEYQLLNCEYKEFYEYFNQRAKEEGKALIDYAGVMAFFKNKGVEGLNNGLSADENEILFTTCDIIEAISLILKGLHGIKNAE